jgi:hypothetical protein
MTANNLTILCPFASVRCSLKSLPADRLMPASLTRSPSVNLENLIVLSISSHSVSSASLKKVCFRKSAVCYRIVSWSWEFSHCKKSSASARKKLRSLYDVNCLAENYFQFGRKGEEKPGEFVFITFWKSIIYSRVCVLKFYVKSVVN